MPEDRDWSFEQYNLDRRSFLKLAILGMITMKTENKTDGRINANLHGHVLARFNNFWRGQYGLTGKNLAGVLFERCAETNPGIYTITDDVFGNKNGKSRFEQIFDEARQLLTPYEISKLGENAFLISREGKIVYFLEGQSLEVQDSGRSYEILTFGRSIISVQPSLNEAVRYLHGEGLLAIAEHPLAEGHYGAMKKEELERLCGERKIDAVEYNAKISVPNLFTYVPKFGGFTRQRNEDAVNVARKCGVPVIANDDSDIPSQIGSAYSIFPKTEIKFDDDESLVKSLNTAIKENNFSIYEGYVNFLDWMKYAVWNVTIQEQILGKGEN